MAQLTALTNFAFATVMDVYGFVDRPDKGGSITAVVNALNAGTAVPKYVPAVVEPATPAVQGYDFILDSLTIANITQEGPVKEARGGIHGKPIIRHKKTIRLEMEDVVARLETLKDLFGAKVGVETFTITDKFPGAITLIGKTYVVDKATGERVWVMIKFEKFLPDGVFEIGMEAGGDFGMININGELFPNDCGEYFTVTALTNSTCDDENA